MKYNFLATYLEPAADVATNYLRETLGIPESKILIETEIAPNIRARPTLQARTKDHHIVCIEISDSVYPPQIDPMMVDCITAALPVHLYVGIPSETQLTAAEITQASKIGVGILTLGSAVHVAAPALSLSLIGVRDPVAKSFPPKHRQAITNAYQNFRTGDPSKGCSCVYDEIERLTRKIGSKAKRKNWWKASAANVKIPDFDNEKFGLKLLARFISDHLDISVTRATGLDANLLDRVPAVVGHRNESAHPANSKAVIKRDRELRTRFETATDLFRDLVTAAAPLNV
ncbi:MAG: hypothetical protein QOK37_3959 [Thermoanaerobaculia bacterium]|jgi:hypothetical protein|nr:hypothetical protein [Thermoanaerobaculia bacterium]